MTPLNYVAPIEKNCCNVHFFPPHLPVHTYIHRTSRKTCCREMRISTDNFYLFSHLTAKHNNKPVRKIYFHCVGFDCSWITVDT